MREIKFRAWNRISKSMWMQDSRTSWEMLRDVDYSNSRNEKMILMQYTGLKDKNGVEIYEGDIVESFEGRYVVRWFDHNEEDYKVVGTSTNYPLNAPATGLGFKKITGDWCHKDFKLCYFEGRNEVIGNIYENPELLATQSDSKDKQ